MPGNFPHAAQRGRERPAALAGAENVFLYAKPAGIQGFVEAAQSAG